LSPETGGGGLCKPPKQIFTAFATNPAHHPDLDVYMQFDSLDEAIRQMREWLKADIDDEAGALFGRYGLFLGPPAPKSDQPKGSVGQ
jgi:hypothetical protein